MLILVDHGTPKGLIRALPGHVVHTAQSRGWDTLSNGALLNAAEEAGCELLLTTDRRMRYQQNLSMRRIAYDGFCFNRTAATAPLFNYLAPSESADEKMVSLTFASWNHVAAWLRQFEASHHSLKLSMRCIRMV